MSNVLTTNICLSPGMRFLSKALSHSLTSTALASPGIDHERSRAGFKQSGLAQNLEISARALRDVGRNRLPAGLGAPIVNCENCLGNIRFAQI